MSGNDVSVKGDLNPSFIDPAADLYHIRVRWGPDVVIEKSLSRIGKGWAGLWSFFDPPDKENIMIGKTTFKDTLNRLRHAVCAFGLLLSLAVAPAYGQQVHQLFYDNGWNDSNLDGPATPVSGLGAFATSSNNGLHVYYLSSTDEVHQAYNVGGGWHDENLTAEAHGPAANDGSNVVGFSVGNLQYVFYVGDDFEIHQLLYNNSVWTDTNLNLWGAPESDGVEIAAFVTTPNNALHVYYVEPGPRVIQAYNVGSGWQFQDLTGLTDGGQPEGRTLTGFSMGNLQYIYYIAFGGDVHQLFYNNASWTDEDLTALAKAVPSPEYPNGAITAMVVPDTKKLRVYYIGTNNHVIQLASTNNVKWTSADLTKKTKGPLADSTNGAVAFATTPNKQIHVYYASGGHVNQLFLPTPATTWQNSDLTALTHGGLATYTGEMAGFSIGNEQYVYYLAQ